MIGRGCSASTGGRPSRSSAPLTPPDDPFDAESAANPFPVYRDLRRGAPVWHLTQPDGLRVWFVVRYTEARAALADPRLAHSLSHARGAMSRAGMELSDDRIKFTKSNLVHSDPPAHTRLRRLVSGAFTPGRIHRLRPRVEQLTAHLLDHIDPDGDVDLVEALNHPLPVLVISELLGVPTHERSELRAWCEAAVTPAHITGTNMSREEGSRQLREYLMALVRSRRSEMTAGRTNDEQPDLVRAMISAGDADDSLSEAEIVSLTYILFLAGHESTVNFLGNAELALARAPELFGVIRDDPSSIPGLVEELLRFDGPVQRGTMRTAVADVEIGGVKIPRGDVVSVGLAPANRDDTRFKDADRIVVDRPDNSHLAFGFGPHYCIGASLARMEAEVVLGALTRRYSRMLLAVAPQELRWRQAFQRGLVALPVRLHARGDGSEEDGR